jgi:hypothetical protein
MVKETLDELKKICFKPNEREKPSYARFITHWFSILVVKLIGNTRITPNQITFLSILVGLAATVFFLLGNPVSLLIGALLLEIFYIFDAVDGQLARYKGLSSVTGAYFDYISNHIIHPLIFFGIGIGLSSFDGNSIYSVGGYFAGFGMIFMYVIYDVKYNMLYHNSKFREPEAGQSLCIQDDISFLKKGFMILHMFCRYPTIMNVITACAILNMFLSYVNVNFENLSFKIIIIFYAFSLNIVWIGKLVKLLTDKELDNQKGD